MCFDAHTAHKICMGPIGFSAFAEASLDCKTERQQQRGEQEAAAAVAMRHGDEDMAEKVEEAEDFCIFGFFKDYIDRKMCVMNKLGWTYEDGTPDYENVRHI